MAEDANLKCPPGCVTVDAPSVDIQAEAPKVEVDAPVVNVEVITPPKEVVVPQVEAEVKAPEVEIKVTAPDVKVEGGDISVKLKDDSATSVVVNCEEKQWDGDTFMGRVKNYMASRRARYLFASNEQLRDSKEIMRKCLRKLPIVGKSEDAVWNAKHMFESTFNLDTGEEISPPVRKSAVIPVEGMITGLMMTFYRCIPGIIFGQLARQSYTSAFDYANRSCDQPEITPVHYRMAYAAGAAASVMTAIGLGSLMKKHHHPVLGRLIPFAGVAAATLIYVPFLNVRTLADGWPIADKEKKPLGWSANAAPWALTAESLGKVCLAAPTLVIPPFLMHHLEYKKKLFCRYPWAQAPIQITLCCLCLAFLTPLIRGTFPDWSKMEFDDLDDCLKEALIPPCPVCPGTQPKADTPSGSSQDCPVCSKKGAAPDKTAAQDEKPKSDSLPEIYVKNRIS